MKLRNIGLVTLMFCGYINTQEQLKFNPAF